MNDFLALCSYSAGVVLIVFIFLNINVKNEEEDCKKALYGIGITVFCVFSTLGATTTVDNITPRKVLSVKTYQSYFTSNNGFSEDKVYYVDDTKIDPDNGDKVVIQTYHGKKPDYSAKLVTRTYNADQKHQLYAARWNIYKDMRCDPNRLQKTLYIVKR